MANDYLYYGKDATTGNDTYSTSILDKDGNSIFADGSVSLAKSLSTDLTGSNGNTSLTGDLFSKDWSMDGLGGTLIGAGQLGLGALSYFENKKTADSQRALLDQQYNINATHEANLEADRQYGIDRRNEAAKSSIFHKEPTQIQTV